MCRCITLIFLPGRINTWVNLKDFFKYKYACALSNVVLNCKNKRPKGIYVEGAWQPWIAYRSAYRCINVFVFVNTNG